jgi:lysophospholipase L1-like esterase
MMKIMIQGDSFGLPRPFKMNNNIEVQYEDCYPEQLRRLLTDYYKDENIILVNSCKRANTSLGVLHDLKNPRFGEVYLTQPDYLVIQVGNVDCFERGKHHDEFAPFIEFRGKNPWVSEMEFALFLAESVKLAFLVLPNVKKIIIVNIPPIAKEENKKNAATRGRISSYNQRLKMFQDIPGVYVADIYKLFFKARETPFSSDGIHPNTYGSRLVAESIFELVKNH